MKPLEGFDVQQTNFDVWDGSVASDFAGGTGTQLDPYLISSASQLAYLASKVNTGTNYSGKYFALTVSLDLNFLEWTPIGGNVGSTTRIFHGIFDGYNHTAANLYVNVDTNYAGLFGYGGTISNLNITDASVTGVNYVGGAAGNATKITNVYFSGTVSGVSNVGGVAGSGSVEACGGSVTVSSSSGNYIGGLTGSGAAVNCSCSGSVDGNNYVGGITGNSNGSISGCSNSADVSGGNHVGGIAGRVEGSTINIENSSNTGNVAGSSRVGGIAGYVYSGYTQSGYTISGCENSGGVNSSGNENGGIAGYVYVRGGSIINCVNHGSVSGAG